MWDWFLNNSVWILIVASLIVILLLVFNSAIRKWLSAETGKKRHKKLHNIVNWIFWTVEGIAATIMVFAFLALSVTSTPASSDNTTANTTAVNFTPAEVEKWFTDGHGFSVLVILITGVILWLIARQTIPPLVGRLMDRPQKGESPEGIRRRADTLKSVFLGVVRGLIVVMVVFMILGQLGVEIGPVLAGFGIVGVAVGFGAQYLVRDLIAGIFILMENQYRVGDVASVGGVSGSVEDINLRKTVLRDLDGIVHHVPNGEIRVASNYSRHFARVNLDISVSYGTDLNYAIGVINDICARMAAEEPWKSQFRTVPQVLRVNNLGDSGIDIKILGETKPLQQWAIMGELRLRIKNEFDKLGIEIPWPHTKVYFGNAPGEGTQVNEPPRNAPHENRPYNIEIQGSKLPEEDAD